MDSPPRPEGTSGEKVPPAPGAALAKRVRVEDLISPLRAEFLLGYLELAIAGALEYARYDRVYLGPWWDVPGADRPFPPRAWKRAVLRRVPTRGAEHWGHLFLVYQETGDRTLIKEDRGAFPPVGTGRPMKEVPLRDGTPRLLLLTRASTARHEEELESFAFDVAERFRRQLD